ncbi:hypothetical protein I79_013913 [Cricetulus griseus]|uniref:Uncharacterized protein n=1 Tax=Cricetulus griseus TaxID=10029 RepID=G3HSR9_CRIGR|nr:hypothetical protein I79_013913 [Cricetulus griseus]
MWLCAASLSTSSSLSLLLFLLGCWISAVAFPAGSSSPACGDLLLQALALGPPSEFLLAPGRWS